MLLSAIAVALAASAAAAAPSSSFILNNKASGVSTGLIGDTDSIKNRVVFARETYAAVPQIEVLYGANGLASGVASSAASAPFAASRSPLVSSGPLFSDLPCAGGKRSPVLIYPRTQMQVVANEDIRLFFVCAGAGGSPFGPLYTATSANGALSWSAPRLVGHETDDGVLLRGLSPVIAGLKIPNRWLLPAQTPSCSLSFVVLEMDAATGEPAVNEDASLRFCADESGAQVSSAAWVRAPASESKGGDNHRLVLMISMGATSSSSSSSTTPLLTSSAIACSMDLSDCSDESAWAEYTPNALGDKGSTDVTPGLATGHSPSLMGVATYALRSYDAGPSAAACAAQFPQLLLASQSFVTTSAAANVTSLTSSEEWEGADPTTTAANVTGSYLTFELSKTISTLYAPNHQGRRLVGALMNAGLPNTPAPAPSQITGVAVVALPPSLSITADGALACAPRWAFFVSLSAPSSVGTVVDDYPSYIAGSFSNAVFDPEHANRDPFDGRGDGGDGSKGGGGDDGQPGLAAAITFCIIGAISLVFLGMFVVGHMRHRRAYAEVAVEAEETAPPVGVSSVCGDAALEEK